MIYLYSKSLHWEEIIFKMKQVMYSEYKLKFLMKIERSSLMRGVLSSSGELINKLSTSSSP